MPELDEVLKTPRYAPRIRPTPIPALGVFDSPAACVTINAGWVSHVLGALEVLDQPDTWIGTEEQIYAARQQVNELMLALRTAICDEGIVDVRQNSINPCILEKSYDGSTWTQFADLSLCASPAPKPPLELYDDMRVHPTTGEPEVSIDGGTTWTPAPTGSTWTPARSPNPGMTQDEQICIAASRIAYNMSEFYRNTYGAVQAGLFNAEETAYAFLANINNLLASIVFPTATSILKGFDFLETYEATQYSASSLSEDARLALTCLLIEHGTVGAYQVVSFDFEAVRDNVISELGVNPGFAVWTHFNYLGEEGINRFGDIGYSVPAECDTCDDDPLGLTTFDSETPGNTLTYDPVTTFYTLTCTSYKNQNAGEYWGGVSWNGVTQFYLDEVAVVSGTIRPGQHHCGFDAGGTACNSAMDTPNNQHWRHFIWKFNTVGSIKFKAYAQP